MVTKRGNMSVLIMRLAGMLYSTKCRRPLSPPDALEPCQCKTNKKISIREFLICTTSIATVVSADANS